MKLAFTLNHVFRVYSEVQTSLKIKGNLNKMLIHLRNLLMSIKVLATAMYRDVSEDYGFLQSLGALDTAAMQWLYGLNSAFASKNDVYYLPRSNRARSSWRCIWDTGGIDRIDGSKTNKSVLIDLRNATLDSSSSAGGYPSSVDGVFGGFTIAHDWNGRDLSRPANLCVIENAVGGRSDDRLIGNSVANVLRGHKR
jgi:serralysin